MSAEPVTYKFDLVAIATVDIRTTEGPNAARAAAASIEDIESNGLRWNADMPPGAHFELACVAPRSQPFLVSTDPEQSWFTLGTEDALIEDEIIPEPIDGTHRDALKAALNEADAALGGDSNDAEHDALYSVRETIAAILGVTYDAPSPDYDDETPHPNHGFVTLDARPGYQDYRVTLRGQEIGGYHTREIAIYELARAMAGDEEFTPAWITGEHGPAAESIETEVYAHYEFSGSEGTLIPLEHTRYGPGDLVIVEGQDWQPWVVTGDWGDLGIQLHALGDESVACFIDGADLDDVQPVRDDRS